MRSAQRRSGSSETEVPQASVNLRRRGFLLSLSAGALGTAAATSAVAQSPIVAHAESSGDSSRGYRETEHVRDYYRTTRI